MGSNWYWGVVFPECAYYENTLQSARHCKCLKNMKAKKKRKSAVILTMERQDFLLVDVFTSTTTPLVTSMFVKDVV